MDTITITNSGKAAMAGIVASTDFFFAWGRGDAAWQSSDFSRSQLIAQTALHDEIGRRKIIIKGYAEIDPLGAIVAGNQRYRQSPTPTDLVYFGVNFEVTDAAGESIRELALFTGVTVDAACPPGQQYFTPASLRDAGQLFALQRLQKPLHRQADTRQSFDIVLPILG